MVKELRSIPNLFLSPLTQIIFAFTMISCSSGSGGGGVLPNTNPNPHPTNDPITATTLQVISPQGTYQFGSITSGSFSTTHDFIFKNSGEVKTNCTITLGDTVNFKITNSTCTSDMVGGASCTVTAKATPGSVGTFQSDLTLACDSNGVSESVNSLINVNSINTTIGTIAGSGYFAPTEVGVDSSTISTFTVSNTFSTPVTGCGAPYLSNGADFYVYGSSCGTSIPEWSQCDFYVKSNPKTEGTRTSNVSFTCSNGGTFNFNSQLTVASSVPTLVWSQGSVIALTQSLSSWTQESAFTAQNNSSYASASNCHSVAVSGDISAFKVDASAFNAQVAAAHGFLGPWGRYDRVKVTPNVTAVGSYTLVLSLTCDNTPVIGAQTTVLTVSLNVVP